jgi:hypothetical protein
MTLGILILILIPALLALPVAAQKSWLRYLAATFICLTGVELPLIVYFASGFLTPDWKGDCPHGWVDCFILGKLALAPLVLLATAALYHLEILRGQRQQSPGRLLVCAVFLGAITSTVCLVFGVVSLGWQGLGWKEWLLVPGYVAVWYSVRTGQLMRATQLGFGDYFWALIGSLPFWIASALWSKSIYSSLPDKAPDTCFIVTAACRGHGKLVGPFFDVEHCGRRVQANKQLITFWKLETSWRENAPFSHKYFRRAYNRLGPCAAATIRSPWLADLAFIALIPIERIASFINRKDI